MIKKLIDTLVEAQEMEDKYGWRSCFDVPDAYDKMEDLNNQAHDIATTLCKNLRDTAIESMLETCRDIAQEVTRGNIDKDTLEVHLYSQDQYIESYITESMDEHAEKVFDSLFYWMSSDDRGAWIQSRYLQGDPYAWTDKRTTFVIMTN